MVLAWLPVLFALASVVAAAGALLFVFMFAPPYARRALWPSIHSKNLSLFMKRRSPILITGMSSRLSN